MTHTPAPIIDQFLDAIWLEKGLSDNTLSSYRRDLTLYDRWLQARGGVILKARKSDVLEWLGHLATRGPLRFRRNCRLTPCATPSPPT